MCRQILKTYQSHVKTKVSLEAQENQNALIFSKITHT